MSSRKRSAGNSAKNARGVVVLVGAGLGLLSAFAVAPACGGASGEERPVASLATTIDAGMSFAAIRDQWQNPVDGGRDKMQSDLAHFLAEFPNDGLAPLARVYLILNLMQTSTNWPLAEGLLAEEKEPPPGTTHDLYLVARAKWLRHHHKPEEAFDLLRPLAGKMVDASARGLLEEEVSHDAVEARAYYEAITYMDTWLRGASEEDRPTVRAKVIKVLALMPEGALETSLRSMRTPGLVHGYGIEIQRLVADRLAEVAIDKGDTALARWLLAPDAGAPMIGGDAGLELGELATSRRGLGMITGRTIGLLLPTGSMDLRDEAADVARGVAWALDLPRTHSSFEDGTKLVTRDDAGDPERMLAGFEELVGEGASIIITALDGASADTAIEWGERTRVPVITLAAPATRKAGAFSFVMGEPPANVLGALTLALAEARGGKVAPVVEGDLAKLVVAGFTPKSAITLVPPVACDVESARAGEPRFPVAAWAEAGVHAWLIAGSADCARDVFHDVGARAKGATFALSLEGATATDRPAPGARVLAAAAGVIPASATPGDPREQNVKGVIARFGGRPDWWMALGRDAAALARKASTTLKNDTVSTDAEIAPRRAAARDALVAARHKLWTTDAEGFDATHVTPRTIRVIELAPPPASR